MSKTFYQGIAEKRLTLPVPMVLGMLGMEESLERVKTPNQTIYVDPVRA